MTNIEGAATFLAILFRKEALALVAAAFDLPAVAAAVGALALAQIILNTVGADTIASTICGLEHKDEAYVVSVDSGFEIDDIGTITAAPSGTLFATLTITANTDASSTCSSTATSTPTGSCPAGQTRCSSSGPCQDILSDPNNCNSCGNVCPSGLCINGACSVPVLYDDNGLDDAAA